MRHRFDFQEPSATVVVTVDVARKPKKSLPKGTPRDMPRVDALVRLIGDYIKGECRGDDMAKAA